MAAKALVGPEEPGTGTNFLQTAEIASQSPFFLVRLREVFNRASQSPFFLPGLREVLRKAGLAAFVLLAVGMASGCHSAPQTMRAVNLEGETKIASAGEFWERRGLGPIGAGGGRRVAIIEFSVEYVTEKLEFPGKSQPKVFGTQYGMTGFAATSVGIGRTQAVFDGELKRKLPGALYGQFEGELKRAGYDVTAMEKVAGARAYSSFKTRKAGPSGLARWLDIGGNDTGNPKKIESYPAEGLQVIKGEGSKEFNAAAADIMNELQADVVLAAKVRLGLFAGRASVEQGSRIWAVTATESGQLWARRSLLSEEPVAQKGKWRLFRGRVYEIDGDRYRAAMEKLFPAYVSLAPVELR